MTIILEFDLSEPGLLDGDKRGMDVWHARKKKVRATHSGPKIYRDACIFKVFDDCRQVKLASHTFVCLYVCMYVCMYVHVPMHIYIH